MPWYKIDISYGPGGQGHDTSYEWYAGTLSADEEKDLCHEAIDNNVCARNSDRAHAKSKLIDKLPENERLKMVNMYRQRIESAQYMLKVLGEDS